MLRMRFVALAGMATFLNWSLAADPAYAQATSEAAAATKSAEAQSQASPVKTTAVAATETEASTATSEPVKVAPPPLPDPTLTVSINLAEQRMTVSENGVVRYSWPISSGTASYPTPRGTFRPQWTSKMWYSKKYDNAPMPHAVFINGGVAVHGTYHTGALGRPASHGCIRLAPANAKVFYNLVHRHGLRATKVSVHGTPNWRSPAVASRKSQKQYADYGNSGWFWGDWGGAGSSAYAPGFTGKKWKKGSKYAVPSSKYYKKKSPRYAAPKNNYYYD